MTDHRFATFSESFDIPGRPSASGAAPVPVSVPPVPFAAPAPTAAKPKHTVAIPERHAVSQPRPTFTDPRDSRSVTSEQAYFPEIDYKGRNYQTIGTRKKSGRPDQPDEVEGPKEHFCTRCKNYYKNLAAAKVFDPKDYTTGWPIVCYGDRSWQMDEWTDERLNEAVSEGIIEDTQEARDYFKISWSPADWAELELGIKPEWYQREMLGCSARYKAIRAGRRIGKSYCVCMYIWWAAYTKCGSNYDRFEILVLCPYEAQVKKLFDDLLTMMQRSPNLVKSIKRSVKAPWEIELHNGSIIRGFSVGAASGARSDKVRGQGANVVVMDEVDYMGDDDIETILAIIASQPDTSVWMSSTPTGSRTKLYKVCHDKKIGFKEIHYISSESPRWTDQAERFFRQTMSDSGFAREYYAEFGEETAGVFNQSALDRCVRDYSYGSIVRNPSWKYVVGVDWNKTTGTHIVVLERGYKLVSTEGGVTYEDPFYRLVDKVVLKKTEFQQTAGVHEVLRIAQKWSADYVYVDQGYGETQVEMLWALDKQMNLGLDLDKKLVSIHGNEPVAIPDPRPGMETQVIKKPSKNFMIDTLAQWVHANRIFFPECEDTSTTIIKADLVFLDVGIIQQMREYKIEGYSPEGRPKYSQGYDHTLMALGFAAIGMAVNFASMAEQRHPERMHYSDIPLGVQAPKPETVPSAEDSVLPYLNKKKKPAANVAAATMPARTVEAPRPVAGAKYFENVTTEEVRRLIEGSKTVGVRREPGRIPGRGGRFGRPSLGGDVRRTIP